jgi:hypothetical protein
MIATEIIAGALGVDNFGGIGPMSEKRLIERS